VTIPEQLTLTGENRSPDEESLGENQRLVLDAIRQWGRVEPDEAGALIHERRGRHPNDVRCDYCGRDGRQVLASLSRRGIKNGRKSKAPGVGPGTEIPF
jgi:hypothetical protein